MWSAVNALQDSAKKKLEEQLNEFQAEYDTAQANAVDRVDELPLDPTVLLSPLSQIGTVIVSAPSPPLASAVAFLCLMFARLRPCPCRADGSS